MVCPTGALTDRNQFGEIEQILQQPSKKLIAQYSPALTGSLAESFGIRAGRDIHGIINATLKKIGFSRVFETSFGIDLCIMEMAEDFLRRFEKKQSLPMITSSCPAWIKFAEQQYPDILPLVSTVKSPQQIMGALIKGWYAKNENLSPTEIYSVSLMSCTAEKAEGQRVEMTQKGIPDIDTVLTTREFSRLIRLHGIDINQLEPEPTDQPMGGLSSTGELFSLSGGLMEGLLRTIYFRMTGREIEPNKLNKLRLNKNVRETKIIAGSTELIAVAVSCMADAVNVLNEVRSGRKHYDLIEIMACQGGCIRGGGQMIASEENEIKLRMKSIYEYDIREGINAAHKNPQIRKIYDEFLTEPMSKKSMTLLHTSLSRHQEF
jgi:iron-only hydrogenase group A